MAEPITKDWRAKRGPKRMTFDLQRVRKLRAEGLTVVQLARRFRVSAGTIYDRLSNDQEFLTAWMDGLLEWEEARNPGAAPARKPAPSGIGRFLPE